MAPKVENIPQKEAVSNITRYIMATMAVFFPGMYVAYNFLDFDMPELKNPVDRVVYTLKWHGLSAAVLFNMFESVMNERSRFAWNPLDPKNQGSTEVLGRILTNTVEQFVMFVVATLSLSTYLNPDQMKIIPIFVILWVIGRLLFQFGYMASPKYRSPGFVMTFSVTYLSLTALAYFQYQEGPMLLSFLSVAFCFKRIYNNTAFFMNLPYIP